MKSKLNLFSIIHADMEICAATILLPDSEMLLFTQPCGEEGAQIDSQFGMLEELKDSLGKPSPGLLIGALSDAGDC